MNYNDLIGIKFTVHGRSKKDGFDCYGVAMEVLKRNGIFLPEIPYLSLEQSGYVRDNIFNKVKYELLAKPCINCIIEIENNGIPNHIAVYIGEEMMIHATKNQGVVVEPLRRYEKRVRGFYKVTNSNI